MQGHGRERKQCEPVVLTVCSTDPSVIPKSPPGSLQSENYFQNNAKLLYAFLFPLIKKIKKNFHCCAITVIPISPYVSVPSYSPSPPTLNPPTPFVFVRGAFTRVPWWSFLFFAPYYMLLFTVWPPGMVVQKLWRVSCCDLAHIQAVAPTCSLCRCVRHCYTVQKEMQ